MTKPITLRNREELESSLAALKITVAQGRDGLLTVYSEAEPRFCYDATSIDEARRHVSNTLASFARTFFGVDAKVTVNVTATDDIVPIEKLRPVSSVQALLEPLAA